MKDLALYGKGAMNSLNLTYFFFLSFHPVYSSQLKFIRKLLNKRKETVIVIVQRRWTVLLLLFEEIR